MFFSENMLTKIFLINIINNKYRICIPYKILEKDGFEKMKNKWILGLFVLLTFGFVGCDNGTTKNEVSCILTADGFKAEVKENVLTFTLTYPSDEVLIDPNTVDGITNVTSGLKVFEGGKPGDSTFELWYILKSNPSSGRYGLLYVNQTGSFTEGSTTYSFSSKGWYITSSTEAKKMAPENNYSPFSDTHHWVVKHKDNGNIVWE
jgi:hypothetical protein